MANTIDIKPLLKSVQKIVEHQKELEIAKGEKFNVFYILKMESKENETHSAFLAELLNPKGSHLQGNVFLKLLLNQLKIEFIDLDSATVKTEFHIGIRDDENKTGGRIDIFISYDNNKNISIENKIYADDQYAQIERYCNYNKPNNRVYYLTLKGDEPSLKSKGKLIEEKDFYILSYRNDIVEWLSACLKEATELPILRESIKQYLLLIKKLTHQMDKSLENRLFTEIINHFDEARYIAENFNNVIYNVGEKVRKSVIVGLEKEIGDKYNIYKGSKINSKYAQIWIKLKSTSNSKMYFGVESFNGSGGNNGDVFIGIFNSRGDFDRKYKDVSSVYWANVQNVELYNNHAINMANVETIKSLYDDNDFLSDFVDHIVSSIKTYISKTEITLFKFLGINQEN